MADHDIDDEEKLEIIWQLISVSHTAQACVGKFLCDKIETLHAAYTLLPNEIEITHKEGGWIDEAYEKLWKADLLSGE